ncbi:hypothetical protein Tco_0922091 [Tanacetum coccineum]|uniref:Uncharacterized protein n=1 Tax=Tanacetum coccineum TaxID=301880 RepID=A0ABQ5CYT3_9ASTR
MGQGCGSECFRVDRIEDRGYASRLMLQLHNNFNRPHSKELYLTPRTTKTLEYFKDKMLLMQAQENGQNLLLDLALNVDTVFQADDYDAFNSDVYEAPTTQTMFMANLSSANPVYDEVGPSCDSDLLLSEDIIKMKAEALKEQTTASRPIKALIVYLLNTHATLVPRVLPTKREKGFEQTKACYLTKVIPFFKTLKEHFEGIQKALTKEVKEMKEIFGKELEKLRLTTRLLDRMHDESKQITLLICPPNDNLLLIACSKIYVYVAMNSVLLVSSFTEIQMPHPVFKARCLELDIELYDYVIDSKRIIMMS